MALAPIKIRAVFTLDKEFIPLANVESINVSQTYIDSEQQVIDKLKDDFVIRIRTLAGFEYKCSMKEMMDELDNSNAPTDPKEFYKQIVFESWIVYFTGEDK